MNKLSSSRSLFVCICHCTFFSCFISIFAL